MVGYGHPVSILAKITYYTFSLPQGRFTENYPWFVPCSLNLFLVIRQKIFPYEIFFHCGHELTPELKAQLNNLVKIFALLSDMFHTAPDGITQGRNNTVYVWMQTQVLTPGMQNAYGSALHCVMTVTKRA
jgi:hypothetical protein